MNFNETGIFQKQKVKIRNLLPKIGIEQARNEIVAGLISKKRFVSSKFFYNEMGSELFEEITKLPEYYPTRTEKSILEDIAFELMNRNVAFEIIEMGSGDCSKISILLNAVNKYNLQNITYIPVDFSSSAVEKSSNVLSIRFPELEINGYVADFIHQLNLIPHSNKPRLICFLGSTIGNFERNESNEIIKNLAKGLLNGDSLLVGFDLVKPEPVLQAAYNDSKGVTEKFNLNVLNVINSIIHSDFELSDFRHHSFYNNEKSRIEMHLIANHDCVVNSSFLKQPLQFKKGDSIHSENSHKYTLESIRQLAKYAGLEISNYYTDSKEWFALVEFAKKTE
jgi:L-histidine Nalpha-methyltransferase